MAHRPSGKSAIPGVLPISASSAQQNAPKASSSKSAAPRLKLLVRRLPPGLTQAEFETALGEEWTVGKGKVDWFTYRPGKLSTDPSKPSKPSRAYLRVTSSAITGELSDKVRQTSFQDARNTYIDPALLGPPSVEFAPYPRVPGGKVRKDARLGTIDQDPEFIAFLESLTNPVPKPNPEDVLDADKNEKITITPLIQYLKEKKANRAKEASTPAKPTKMMRPGHKDIKVEKVQARRVLSRAEKAAAAPVEKPTKIDRATKDAVKAANKHIVGQTSKQRGGKAPPAGNQNEALQPSQQPAPTTPTQTPERKRERGNLSAATKILRRDLGLTPPRKRGEKAPSAATPLPATSESKQQPSTPSTDAAKHTPPAKASKEDSTPKASTPKLLRKPPTEPMAARNSPKAPNVPTGPKNAPSPSPRPAPPQTTGTQAFLKHANASQGVTEELLEAGFSKFGEVVKVEIDRKKGFGYVDFAEPGSLHKALQASPVQIAQSQVVVLERRSTAAVAQARGNHVRHQPPPLAAARPPPGGALGGGGGSPAPARQPPQGPRGGGRGGPRHHRGGYGRRNGPPGGDRPGQAASKQSNAPANASAKPV